MSKKYISEIQDVLLIPLSLSFLLWPKFDIAGVFSSQQSSWKARMVQLVPG